MPPFQSWKIRKTQLRFPICMHFISKRRGRQTDPFDICTLPSYIASLSASRSLHKSLAQRLNIGNERTQKKAPSISPRSTNQPASIVFLINQWIVLPCPFFACMLPTSYFFFFFVFALRYNLIRSRKESFHQWMKSMLYPNESLLVRGVPVYDEPGSWAMCSWTLIDKILIDEL